MKLWISAVAIIMLCASPVLAQNVLPVPEDYSTIQAAVDAAIDGDTIRVGPGTYCGANIGKRLTILGEGEPRPTITGTGCGTITTGLNLIGNAGGTIIQNLNFDILQGIAMTSVSGITIAHNSFSNVFIGIQGVGTDYVTIEHNTITMQSGFGGILSIANKRSTGNFWTVSHNNIHVDVLGLFGGIGNITGSGWTVSHNNLTGAGLNPGILIGNARNTRAVNNIAEFNYIEGAVNGVGIGIYGQDGTVVRNNRIFMPSNPEPVGVCGAHGIEIGVTGTMYRLTSINSVIMNNDTRGTAVGVFVLLDSLGGTGNSIGNELRGNFGTLVINQSTAGCDAKTINEVTKNRAIWTLINCDETGVCPDIP